jgi:hypothetical protein
MTKEATLEKPDLSGYGEEQEVSRNLPPLLILDVNQSASIVLADVSVVAQRDSKGRVKEGEFRYFYNGKLAFKATGETQNRDTKEYEEVTFEAGTLVSIPGSGGLDYSMACLARKDAGQKKEEEPKFSVLNNHLFTIERLADEKMKSGAHEGKPVKSYKLTRRAPKASK